MASAIQDLVVSPGIEAGSPFVVGDALIVQQAITPQLAQSTPVIHVDTSTTPNQVQIGSFVSNLGVTVIGKGATVTGGAGTQDAVVIGTNATTDHQQAIAIGKTATVTGGPDVAIGANTVAHAGAVAIGNGTQAGTNAVAVGAGAGATKSAGQVMVGQNANADTFGIAVGSATALLDRAKGSGSIAIGRGASAGESTDVIVSSGGVTTSSASTGGGNVAVMGSAGPGVAITGQNNVLVGGGSGEASTANDNNPNTGTHSNCILIGGGLTAAHDQVIMIGRGATSTAANQCVIGGTFAPIASVLFGNGPVAVSPQNVTVGVTGGSGADDIGATLTIAGGIATGAGLGGSIIFQTSIVAGSSSTPQALATALTIDNTQLLTFAHAPKLTDTSATGAVVLTLTNGPTAAGAGNPQVYLQFKNGTHTYAVPAWQVA